MSGAGDEGPQCLGAHLGTQQGVVPQRHVGVPLLGTEEPVHRPAGTWGSPPEERGDQATVTSTASAVEDTCHHPTETRSHGDTLVPWGRQGHPLGTQHHRDPGATGVHGTQPPGSVPPHGDPAATGDLGDPLSPCGGPQPWGGHTWATATLWGPRARRPWCGGGSLCHSMGTQSHGGRQGLCHPMGTQNHGDPSPVGDPYVTPWGPSVMGGTRDRATPQATRHHSDVGALQAPPCPCHPGYPVTPHGDLGGPC